MMEDSELREKLEELNAGLKAVLKDTKLLPQIFKMLEEDGELQGITAGEIANIHNEIQFLKSSDLSQIARIEAIEAK